MIYDHETYGALVRSGALRTWSDGFGRWYVEVSETIAGPMLAARGAVWYELRTRAATPADPNGDAVPLPRLERAPAEWQAVRPGHIIYRETSDDTDPPVEG